MKVISLFAIDLRRENRIKYGDLELSLRKVFEEQNVPDVNSSRPELYRLRTEFKVRTS